MHMGRERGVLRWDIHHSLLDAQLTSVEEALAALDAAPVTPKTTPREHAGQRERLRQQRFDLLQQIAQLGPAPRAKMG